MLSAIPQSAIHRFIPKTQDPKKSLQDSFLDQEGSGERGAGRAPPPLTGEIKKRAASEIRIRTCSPDSTAARSAKPKAQSA